MKVCVFGAGAIGGHLAARLARGGAEVSVVARGAHLAAMQANGLTVHAHDGTHVVPVRASADPAELGPQDAVVVTVKAPALPAVAAGIAPLLAPDTPVAFVMNGIPWWYFLAGDVPMAGLRLPEVDPDGVLERSIGIQRTIGGVVYSATEVIAPGVVRSEHGNIRVILGEPDGSVSDRARALSALLEAGGMPSPVTPDIRAAVWSKLLGNLSSGPICSLTRLGVRDSLADPALRAMARTVAEEARAIAASLGISIGDDVIDRVSASNMQHKPSILQDLELGRPMEIDALFGVPLKLAALTGARAPNLSLLVALVKQAARGQGLYPPIG
ncbi:ketopantoate reductase family protein [Falsiroseomonas stagni]|uniref:2-dehydropantoate 2-reductase n=1 Tax=Falsiroseomonas stagni DSM 19981 TaxID=1123062 RepID=A0A1I3Z751_9PROT|nr:2-dehydropantoate 2-reductase [Falsiroseomonas stagni]SFK39837.1 2-dehydropantoate 2-reductase [Falsiroseomonas stagni DSM 19981]